MRFWTVPRLWPGATVFVLGGGPSLETQGTERLRGRPCIAVNRSYERHPWADFLFAADERFLREHRATIEGPWRGRVVTVTACLPDWRELKRLRKLAPPSAGGKAARNHGLAAEPDTVTVRSSSLQAAINMAVHAGAARIVTVGADGGPDAAGRTHHHAPHKWRGGQFGFAEQYADLKTTVPALAAMGVELVNASPGTKLPFWPVTTLDAVLGETEAGLGLVRPAKPTPDQ